MVNGVMLMPKEKVQKDKQRSTKHAYKTKDRVKRTSLKTGGELRCAGGYSVPDPLVIKNETFRQQI
jgi:hypothetical protein